MVQVSTLNIDQLLHQLISFIFLFHHSRLSDLGLLSYYDTINNDI